MLVYFLDADKDSGQYLALIPVGFIGMWFGIYQAAYWPGISLLVEDHVKRKNEAEGKGAVDDGVLSSIAYGIVNAVNNIGMAIYPFLYGWINNVPSKGTYKSSTMWLAGEAAIGTVCMGILWAMDMKGLQILHKREKKADGETMEGCVD